MNAVLIFAMLLAILSKKVSSLVCVWLLTLGSLSMHVFEMRTATGREDFACQDRIVSQIFLVLSSNEEKILSNVNVVV